MSTNLEERNDRAIDELDESMVTPVYEIIDSCKKEGVDLLIYCAYRSMEEQARAYRSTRSKYQIADKHESLESKGFPELAKILHDVGPQQGVVGRHITFAAPGESWHNYYLAFDAVPIKHGKCMWAANNLEWLTYGGAVKRAGLHWAGHWISFKEYPHTQAVKGSNPLKVLDGDRVHSMIANSSQIDHDLG